jgi:Ca2+-binding EF-hand superfamily protein
MALPVVSLSPVSGKKDSFKKQHTSSERVSFFSKTSDAFGAHLRTDLESYLTLIRRMIQEKCGTTQDLINRIRRTKVSESAHVTPTEFRFTLIKFGITLPQPLVDRVFNVFDSDRSGTMDFDEFAMWIMNSELKPKVKGRADTDVQSHEEKLRDRLVTFMKKNPNTFGMMKKQVSFLEFVSDVTRLGINITEKEARRVFVLFDPEDTGFIEAARLRNWLESGDLELPPRTPAVENTPRLQDSIIKVCGRNSKQMEACFTHIPENQGIRVPYEEFRRCLLSAGLGRNPIDTKQLFLALGGRSGTADIDMLRQNLTPMPALPGGVLNSKIQPSTSISTSRADRRLRDALRKSFKDVKAEIEAADQSGTGFLDTEVLHKILHKLCLPLNIQDFRFIIQQVAIFLVVLSP